jgi:hypothetical protein
MLPTLRRYILPPSSGSNLVTSLTFYQETIIVTRNWHGLAIFMLRTTDINNMGYGSWELWVSKCWGTLIQSSACRATDTWHDVYRYDDPIVMLSMRTKGRWLHPNEAGYLWLNPTTCSHLAQTASVHYRALTLLQEVNAAACLNISYDHNKTEHRDFNSVLSSKSQRFQIK